MFSGTVVGEEVNFCLYAPELFEVTISEVSFIDVHS
jgi:hypothetical protein